MIKDSFDKIFDILDSTIGDTDIESMRKKVMLISYELGMLGLELEIETNKRVKQ